MSAEMTMTLFVYAIYANRSQDEVNGDARAILRVMTGKQPRPNVLTAHTHPGAVGYRGPNDYSGRLVEPPPFGLTWHHQGTWDWLIASIECHAAPGRWESWLQEEADRLTNRLSYPCSVMRIAFVDYPRGTSMEEIEIALQKRLPVFAGRPYSFNDRVRRGSDNWWMVLAEEDDPYMEAWLLSAHSGSLPRSSAGKIALLTLADRASERARLLETVSATTPRPSLDLLAQASELKHIEEDARLAHVRASALTMTPDSWLVELDACQQSLNAAMDRAFTAIQELAGRSTTTPTRRTPMLRNTTSRPLRILHISDLHERSAFDGMPDDRKPKLDQDARERGRVLGDSFLQELHSLVESGIDLVCFTGDLADWGHPAEYAKAEVRLRQILDTVEVPPSRFFAVPGNHDVQRREKETAWRGIRQWLARGGDAGALGRWMHHAQEVPPGLKSAWRDQILQRSGAFWECLESLQRGELRPQRHTPLGYRRTLPAGTFGHIHLPIHVVGLNSAWLCGGDETKRKVTLKDDKSILLTTEQVDAHIRDGERALDGFRLALVHHPLELLADYHDVRRLLGDNGVDLLLHGHQHKEVSMTQRESGACLSVLAAGCLMEGDLGRNWPNGFHLIEVDVSTGSGSVHFRQWSKDSRGWAPATGIYREARDGVLPLELRARVDAGSATASHDQQTSGQAFAVPNSHRVVDGVSVSVVLARQSGADESLSKRWITAIEGALRKAGLRVESESAEHTLAAWADNDELGGQSLHYQLNMQGPCNLPMSRLEDGATSVTEVVVQHVIATQISRGEPVVVRLVNSAREYPSSYRTTFRLEAPLPVSGPSMAAGERWLAEPLERIATALSRVSPSAPLVLVPQCTPAAAIRAGAVLNRVADHSVKVFWQGEEWSLDTAGSAVDELTNTLDGRGIEPRNHLCLVVSIFKDIRPDWLQWAGNLHRVPFRALHVCPVAGPSQDVLKTPEQAVGWARQIGQWLREKRLPSDNGSSIFAATPGPISVALGRELNAIGRVYLLDFDTERQEYVNAFEFTT